MSGVGKDRETMETERFAAAGNEKQVRTPNRRCTRAALSGHVNDRPLALIRTYRRAAG